LDFFAFLAFFAFFAFFAFLAIVSSQGLMDGNATRGMLGGGPTSQHPRMQSQQIRGVLPRTVTSVSARYPQLLCVLARFHAGGGGLRRKNLRAMNDHAAREASAGLTNLQLAGGFCIDPEQAERRRFYLHHFKTTARIALPRVRVR
jgi:hypothetical protein